MGHGITNDADLGITSLSLGTFCHTSLQATHNEFNLKTTVANLGAAVHVGDTAPATTKLWVKVDGSDAAEGCTGIHFYNTDTSAWEVFSSTPSGTLNPFAGTATPDGWLLCDGAEYSKTTYARLFAAIGENYDVTTPASGNFMVPDMRGRVPVGVDGAGARMTENDTIGDVGGAEKVTLTGAQSGTSDHTHKYYGSTVTMTSGNGEYRHNIVTNPENDTHGTVEADASSAHDNMPPYLVIANYIIKT